MDQAMSLSTPLYCVQRQSNDLYQRIVWRCVCIAQNCTPTANSRLNISTLWTHWTHVGTCSPEHVWHDNATLSNWGPFFSSCESFSFTSYFRVHVCCVWRREANSSLLLFFVCFFLSFVHTFICRLCGLVLCQSLYTTTQIGIFVEFDVWYSNIFKSRDRHERTHMRPALFHSQRESNFVVPIRSFGCFIEPGIVSERDNGIGTTTATME